jgi:hypothetical protein
MTTTTHFVCEQCRTDCVAAELPEGWLLVRHTTTLGPDKVMFCSTRCARLALEAGYDEAAWQRQAQELADVEDQPPWPDGRPPTDEA